CDCTAFLSVIALSKVKDTGMPTPTVVPLSGVYVPMKLPSDVTVVKLESATAVRPSRSFAAAAIRYFVPRSNCFPAFHAVPSGEIGPDTAAPESAAVIFTSVRRPPLTLTPVELIDAPVDPSFAEMAILATDTSTDWRPPLPSRSPSAWALPPQAVRVRAPTMRAAPATSARRAVLSRSEERRVGKEGST